MIRRTAIRALILLMGAAALLSKEAVPDAVAQANASQRQLLHPVPGRPFAPHFQLPNLEGEMRRLADFRGKIVIVNFWATWCPPCRFEIPSMQRVWNQLKDKGVMMLAVHVGGDDDKIWTFATDFNVEFPILIDKTSSVSRAWGTIGLPTTFIVDPEGRMALRAIGGREWDDPALMEAILELGK